MKKILFSALIILFFSQILSMEPKEIESLESYKAKRDQLIKVAVKYQQFLSNFGQEEVSNSFLPLIEELFAPRVKKFVNGNHVAISETRESLYFHLRGEKKEKGMWDALEYDLPVVDVEEKTIIVHLEIPTEKMGTIIVMKKLICDKKGLIEKIDEVSHFKVAFRPDREA